MNETVELLILGDICSAEGMRSLFDSGSCSEIFGSLAPRLQAADLAIANLECVLTDVAPGVEKIGPVLVGRPSDARVLFEAGIDLVGVANNHIGDCGSQGVRDTIAASHAAGLLTVGAGLDSRQAGEPAIVLRNGIRVGVVAVAEREFNSAGVQEPGAHIFEPLDDLESIALTKQHCDFVVVMYHGGIEHYQYPSPRLMRACRSMIRHGADLVLCQHSHTIGAVEEYMGGSILYGQGNAVYGYRRESPDWNQGLAVSVSLSREKATGGATNAGTSASVAYVPIGCDSFGRVGLLSEDEARTCLYKLAERSRRCLDVEWLENSWRKFALRSGDRHLPHVLGLGRVLTRLNRLLKGKLVAFLYSRRQRLVSLNVVRCDAHREVIETAYSCSLSKK